MLLWFIVATGILIVSGIVYQTVAAAKDNRMYQPPGQMIDIGGRRLHLVITGEDNGRPTVILEQGMASFSSNWYWVQTELSVNTRVVSYDRAGLGWSDPPPATHDAFDSAADLFKALQEAGISGPYIVAGHSYGGLVVRAFTELYPGEVVGMVLVDASHPDQWVNIPASRNGQIVALVNKATGWLARLGVIRLFNMNQGYVNGLPERKAAEMKANFNQPLCWMTSSKTLTIWHKRTRPRINRAHGLEDLPLVVLGVTEQAHYAEILTRLQADLATLSTNSVHYTVQGATHVGLVAEREHAMAVVEAIRQVLEAAQSNRPLSKITATASEATTL